jgi:large subunit ribosomal protein L30
MAFIAIRLRGQVNLRYDFKLTLESLNLTRVNHAVVIPEDPYYMGMLKKAKDFITWGKLDKETLQQLLEQRGRLMGDKALTEEHLAANTEFKDLPLLCDAIIGNEFNYKNIPDIKPIFRLAPPKKGLRGIKRAFTQGGSLGYRDEKINELVRRMI